MKKVMLNLEMGLRTKSDGHAPTGAILPIPETEATTTADRLLYLKDCLDKKLIDEAGFRSLRDQLTYGRVQGN